MQNLDKPSSEKMQKLESVLNGTKGLQFPPYTIDFRKWTLSTYSPAIDANGYYVTQNYKLAIGKPYKEDDMTRTPRNLYYFAVVYSDTDIDYWDLVAETEQAAREEIIQDKIKDGVKVKDVEIVLTSTVALKPRVTKDG